MLCPSAIYYQVIISFVHWGSSEEGIKRRRNQKRIEREDLPVVVAGEAQDHNVWILQERHIDADDAQESSVSSLASLSLKGK